MQGAANLMEKVRLAGVVGAGGGGFPTHVKLAGRADTVIANGAECEPLLHKDAACMEHQAAEVVEGVRLAMEAVGAKDGFVAVKAKNAHAVEAVREACAKSPVRVKLLGDYYPAGDEYDLVHEVTGRLIPPAGIPLDVGVVVANVETLANVTAAARGEAVTRKLLTVAGAVGEPTTLWAPLGTPLREVIAAAGGAKVPDPVLCLGGMMMGSTTADLDTPVTKTLGGVIVLSRQHHAVQRKLKTGPEMRQIGKSACDQCRYCTELCPRYLLGYAVEPHQVMRTLGLAARGASYFDELATLCCACGLCTIFACPEELYPKEACDDSKAELRKAGPKLPFPKKESQKPHPFHRDRRVPINGLMKKLRIEQYAHPAPLSEVSLSPARAVVPLKQGAGAPNKPLVKPGDRVRRGQPLGELPQGALGAIVHAPFDATVGAVDAAAVTLARTP